MAERELSSLIGDALVALLDCSWPKFKRRVRELVEHVADLVRPHPPMSLRTLSNEVVTGLLVLDRGAALLFIGIREPAPSIVTPSPVRDSRHFDDDGIPPWARDVRVDPYRR